ncbi:MAG: (deoxy)nucleoside triphosphate pyrophosphohydrolase [Erythrobacter sp.]
MQNIPTWQPVVAAALRRADGLWLMHKRPQNKHHGGLWEFPGGKVETGEVPVIALIRELSEELGIRVKAQDCIPACFAEESKHAGGKPIVILLYTLLDWEGEPEALEGGEIGWFSSSEAFLLEKPPLDVELAALLFKQYNS